MNYLDTIKNQIGQNRFERLEKEADKELSFALNTPLKNKYGDKQYYRKRVLIGELFADCHFFDEKGLGILPTDLVGAMFRAKLLFASPDEASFLQRSGEGMDALGIWSHKPAKFDEALEAFFEWIKDSIKERTLLTQLSSFIGPSKSGSGQDYEAVQRFFEQFFQKLGAPFVAFVNQKAFMDKYKQMQPELREYTEEHCQQYFYAPSIGFTVTGSESYCYLYAAAWLRTFLQLLRIAGFVHTPQIDSHTDVSFLPPKGSVWLGSHAEAAYSWLEGAFESWRKSPDGNLFVSFGYRRLSKMWLDNRTFRKIEDLILSNRKILESMKHPWKEKQLRDVVPTLDLLNTVTQLPDEGVKLLLLYCCLEHLFVPPNFTRDNKKYIVGGMHALRPDLLEWFNRLYKQRCAYAHKGFLVPGEETRGLMVESVNNVLALIMAKLANN
jgi:hypothetical protein